MLLKFISYVFSLFTLCSTFFLYRVSTTRVAICSLHSPECFWLLNVNVPLFSIAIIVPHAGVQFSSVQLVKWSVNCLGERLRNATPHKLRSTRYLPLRPPFPCLLRPWLMMLALYWYSRWLDTLDV